MKNTKKPSKQKLLSEVLIKKDKLTKFSQLLPRLDEPVNFAITNGFTNNKDFYPNLAKVFGLDFLPAIKTPMSAVKLIAQQVPLDLLVQDLIYIYEKQNKLYVVTSTPFIKPEKIENILQYTGYDKYNLAIAHPNEIRNALALASYNDVSIVSEDRINVFFPNQSARTYETLIIPKLFPIFSMILLMILTFLYPQNTLTVVFMVLNLTYFFINPYKLYIFIRSFKPLHSIVATDKDIQNIDYFDLPWYSVLVPLKNEGKMVSTIVNNMAEIEYPMDKLDVKFAVEVEDEATIGEFEKLGIGLSSRDASISSLVFHLVKVPAGEISTKPRSCDYALGFSRGEYICIYDAEDKPDPDQLKKAVYGFGVSTMDTVCIQSRLNYFNSRKNLLTRLFSLEYGFWFDYYLPGLQEVGSPIPLGGTSNHFITSIIKKIGVWDPFNVTEDADLGLRIFRNKLKVSVINSKTLEEANSRFINWLRQRTRWQKGFLVTFLVHISHPRELLKDLGFKKFILSSLAFGGNFFLPLMNPFLWLVFLASVSNAFAWFKIPSPPEIFVLIAVFNLIVGNLIYIVIHSISCIKNKRYDLLPFNLLMPFYWMMISIATYRAAWQFVTNPFYWEKTEHGLM